MTVESVIGCPVIELTSGRAQKSGYGVTAETDQVTEQMTSDAFDRGRTVCLSAPVQELIDSVEERCGVFFTVTGEAGTWVR
jgi:hypothetical protein